MRLWNKVPYRWIFMMLQPAPTTSSTLFGEPGNPSEEIWQDAEISALFDSKFGADITHIVKISCNWIA